MDSLIFISLENWDEIWRRNQFICAELSRRYPERKILFVGLPHDVFHSVRKRRPFKFWPSTPQPLPDFPNIFFFRPVKWWPNTLKIGRLANEWVFRRQVRAAARSLGLKKSLLWINPHSAVHIVGKMGEAGVVYDITDDWISCVQKPAASQLIAMQDAELCRSATATIVCSQHLFEMKKSLARQLFLIPNGVDVAHYAGVADGSRSPHPTTQQWNHPVLGYVGTVHPERVDVDLVEKVARAFPKSTVALIGPDLLMEDQRRQLHECGNVVLAGAVPYQQVPEFLAAIDLCLVPHVETAFTESLNPIKLWEYFACGKPIVSTNVAGFRDFGHLCRVVNGSEQFVAACKETLTNLSEGRTERLKVAASNSWAVRADEIERILDRIEAS